MTRIFAVAAILLLAAAPASAADDWRFGLAADLLHDDNATRGLFDGKKADDILSLEGSATRSMQLGARTGATFGAIARYSHFSRFDDLSNLALSARAAWRIQPGLDFSSPFFELAANLAWLRHADSELRDGSIVSLDASTGSHVTDRTRLSGGVGADKRSGGGTAGLYDLTTNRIWGAIDLRVGLRNIVYGRITRTGGDHVFSSGSVSGLSGVWEDDPALRGPLGLTVANAYRLEATTFSYELGFNYPLSRGSALDFSLARIDSKVKEGVYQGTTYGVTQFRAGYLHRFQ
jgi:hypothetical protein